MADRYRRELLAHCYRMLGSATDAEDVVQETYLRAWRNLDRFEGRSSLRTWLYRIATNACLEALEGSSRRPLPSGLGGPSDPGVELGKGLDVPWLEPFPDPADIVEAQHDTRLALVAALQHLPPRQRAVLILRDVLTWRAAEVAELLGTTPVAVNSALHRARAQLAQVEPARLAEPSEPRLRELLDSYATAFERADVQGLVRLMAHDAIWEMPPLAEWFSGREAIGSFLSHRLTPGAFRLVPVRANGQPGFTVHQYGRQHALQVLEVAASGVVRIVHFLLLDDQVDQSGEAGVEVVPA
ncbi:sigma-70 family RNA polymerase sigma factor [Nonomuraea sp. NPDC050556]|uniref:sigma-70 family RNA polymerase sigma factor n=1 Tax=Nonomuraea sp. NPDC050556 TaxID=3364369 RepID=UPI003790D677